MFKNELPSIASLQAALKPADDSRLKDLTAFGSNPGALRARYYVPSGLAAEIPLVVVLHGCTQTAAQYDHGVGWSALADEHGFAVLYPEQQRANNSGGCFNWFSPGDTRRDAGEALSIRQMIEAMNAVQPIDRRQVFITGLSAGGAMACVMLSTYPELFAGGAIIAGLPYGRARSVPEALELMRGAESSHRDGLGTLVREASPHTGPWPRLSIWQGTGDHTVVPANADLIVEQWRQVHGPLVERSEGVEGFVRHVWSDAAGEDVIQDNRIAGMGHGTPLATTGADACGAGGAFMIDVGVSSTRHIARFWNLIPAREYGVVSGPDRQAPDVAPTPPKQGRSRRPGADGLLAQSGKGPGAVIDKALRAAGLIR